MGGKKTGKRSGRPITVKVNPRIDGIVRSYLEHRKQDMISLLLALEDGEFDRIRSVAHDLVGTGGSFGFKHMSVVGRSLEIAAKERES
jgi:HPt (histidine-containing phosphotransfer) domain-containing protein